MGLCDGLPVSQLPPGAFFSTPQSRHLYLFSKSAWVTALLLRSLLELLGFLPPSELRVCGLSPPLLQLQTAWPKIIRLNFSILSYGHTFCHCTNKCSPNLLFLNLLCSTLPESLFSKVSLFLYFECLKGFFFYLSDFSVFCSQRIS